MSWARATELKFYDLCDRVAPEILKELKNANQLKEKELELREKELASSEENAETLDEIRQELDGIRNHMA